MLGDVELLEGASKSVVVNPYERNPVARRRCLEHYGNACFACGMSFRETYGSLGAVVQQPKLEELRGRYTGGLPCAREPATFATRDDLRPDRPSDSTR